MLMFLWKLSSDAAMSRFDEHHLFLCKYYFWSLCNKYVLILVGVLCHTWASGLHLPVLNCSDQIVFIFLIFGSTVNYFAHFIKIFKVFFKVRFYVFFMTPFLHLYILSTFAHLCLKDKLIRCNISYQMLKFSLNLKW